MNRFACNFGLVIIHLIRGCSAGGNTCNATPLFGQTISSMIYFILCFADTLTGVRQVLTFMFTETLNYPNLSILYIMGNASAQGNFKQISLFD